MEMKYSLIGRIQNKQFSELKEEMTSLVAKKIANRIQAAKEDAIKKINESNIVENKDIRAFYQSKSPNFLKKIINTAANTYKLHASWDAPNTDDKDELISHINDMSNDHQLSPGSDGHLVKRP